MSVSIRTTEAEPEFIEVECDYCADQDDDWVDPQADNWDDECYFCKGGGVARRRVHYMNMANGNARLILGIVGLDDPYLCGSVEPKDIPVVRQRIVRALNNGSAQNWERAPESDGRFHMGGYSDERIAERLRQFDAILARAQEKGVEVSWG